MKTLFKLLIAFEMKVSQFLATKKIHRIIFVIFWLTLASCIYLLIHFLKVTKARSPDKILLETEREFKRIMEETKGIEEDYEKLIRREKIRGTFDAKERAADAERRRYKQFRSSNKQ